MDKKKIITGLLSYGMSGKIFHAPFLSVNEHFEFRAVVERTKKIAQGDYPNLISYNSVEQLLMDPDIELVVVNTPNDTHVEFAVRALEAGKHVLIEKPFAPTAHEAATLFELGAQKGKLVLPYHNRRFDSDFRSLQYVLEKRFVGSPIELHIRFDRYKAEIGPKTFKETNRPGAGILYDLGSHMLDQVISLFGKPKSVTKIKGTYRPKSKVDDYGVLILNYKSGLNVFLTASMLAADPQASFVLHGTEGSFVKRRTDVQEHQLLSGVKPDSPYYGVEYPGSEGMLTVRAEGGGFERISVPPERGDYNRLFDEVHAAIRLGKPYFISSEHILWQLEILEPSKSRA